MLFAGSVNAEVKENDENVADGFQRSAQKETPREVSAGELVSSSSRIHGMRSELYGCPSLLWSAVGDRPQEPACHGEPTGRCSGAISVGGVPLPDPSSSSRVVRLIQLREASAQYKRLKSEVRALKRRVKSKGHRLVLEVAEAEEARRRVVQHLSPASPEQQMVNGGSNKGTPLLPSPARWGEAELLWWEEEVVGGPPEEEEHKADLLP